VFRCFSCSGKSEVDDLFELFTSFPFDEEEEINFFYDQRNTNQGRPTGDFDEFYEELDRILEEFGKAAEESKEKSYRTFTISCIHSSSNQTGSDSLLK